MAVFSVFNYETQRYDYYEGSGPKGTQAGTPPMRRASSELGATPEQASWKVPMGARKVGSGELPQGRIAAMGDAGADPMAEVIHLGTIAGLAYLAWKVLR